MSSSPVLTLGLTPSASLVLRTSFEFGLNYTTGFPGFPAYRHQIMGLLSLNNHVNNKSIYNINIAGSVSLENSNTD